MLQPARIKDLKKEKKLTTLVDGLKWKPNAGLLPFLVTISDMQVLRDNGHCFSGYCQVLKTMKAHGFSCGCFCISSLKQTLHEKSLVIDFVLIFFRQNVFFKMSWHLFWVDSQNPAINNKQTILTWW